MNDHIISNNDDNTSDDDDVIKKKIINSITGNGVICWSRVGHVIDCLVTKLQ